MSTAAERILADLRADVTAFEAGTERATQTQTGASQIYGCVAESIYRLRGVPATVQPSWDLLVGKAVHEYLATARAKVRPGVLVEQRLTYKGVPCTVDYIDPPLLIDYKTDKDVEDIAGLADRAKPKWLAQVHLGAMAARESGVQVDEVALLVLPRSGEFDDARVLGPWPVDPTLADEAAQWAADTASVAASDADPRDFRGMPAYWCRAYCGFVSACRGDEQPDPDLAELEPIAARYYQAGQDARAAEQTRKDLRPLLVGVNGVAGAYRVSTAGGRDSMAEDLDELRGYYKFMHGELPLKPARTPVQLRITPVKGA